MADETMDLALLSDIAGLVKRGVGRPDVPAGTGGVITGSEPVGTLYISTDGAGVGAYQWQKTVSGWVVTVGDTGGVNVSALLSDEFTVDGVILPRCTLRRTGNRVTLALRMNVVEAYTGTQAKNPFSEVPGGFKPASRYAQLGVVGNQSSFTSLQLYAPHSGLQIRSSGSVPSGTQINGEVSWITNDPWPTTLPGTAA